MYDAVGFVKTKSYAIETSPGELNDTGRLEVTVVSEIEKSDELVSKMLKRFPVVVPYVPILSAKRSPVAVVADPGLQSRFISEPIPAVPVSEVAVDDRLRSVPDVSVFPVGAIFTNFPVVTESDVKYAPVPELIAVASNTNPDVVVVPVATFEVNV